MTEHFTSEEAVALASTIVEDDDYESVLGLASSRLHRIFERQHTMTTNLLSVIEQQHKALEHCVDAIVERGLNGSQEQARKWGLQLPLERAYAALAAGRQALEQARREAQGKESDAGFFSREAMMAHHILKDHPQATEPAPSTDICQNCAGQGWEPSVYKGKVPCSFCQPAPSTAGELTLEQITRIYDRYGGNMVNCAHAIARQAVANYIDSKPVGELTAWIATKDQYPPEGVRVFWLDENSNRVGYDTWAGGDYIWSPTHWMHIPATAAARSQPTTEESSVVAGAQPVREPLTPDTHYQEWKHGCDSMCTNITLWIDRCPHCGKPRPVVEAAHGITKKGEQ